MRRAPCIDTVATGAAAADGRTDNTPSLNALLEVAPAGATICFPLGTYAWSGVLRVQRDDIALIR